MLEHILRLFRIDKVHNIVSAIKDALPEQRPIGLHIPSIGLLEFYAVQRALDRIQDGDYVKEAQNRLANYLGVENVVCVSSGTAALHLALLAAGVKPGEEVLVPTINFVAGANAISYCGAIPNFVDGFCGINAYKLRRYLERTTRPAPGSRGRLNSKTERVISALIVVDLLGFPADMAKLQAVADEFGLVLIEDAAQALGSSLDNRKCGSFGAISTLSFNNNKIVTGNGGGAVVTNDPWFAARAQHLATTARIPHKWKMEHDEIGFNYRMPNLCAALVCAQLTRINEFLTAKVALHKTYTAALEKVGVKLLKAAYEWQGKPNYWLNAALLDVQQRKDKQEILDSLHKIGIGARAMFTPTHELAMYSECPRDENLMYAQEMVASAICLPSGVGLV